MANWNTLVSDLRHVEDGVDTDIDIEIDGDTDEEAADDDDVISGNFLKYKQ